MNAESRSLMVEKFPKPDLDGSRPSFAKTVERRDRHQIASEILEVARTGIIKTRIMYAVRLSAAQLEDYLPFLVERGFLENIVVPGKRKDKRVWKTTRKGMEFLENFRLLEL